MTYLRFIPFIIVGIVSLTTFVCFYLAVCKFEHVTYLWPYISDTGTFPPESCIFGQGLNMVAFLLFFGLYVKYKQVKAIYKMYNIVNKCNINKIAFFIGTILCFGITLVANFQETNVFGVHMTGAILTFGGGAIYVSLQSYIYWSITPVFGQKKTTIFRIFLSVVAVITFIAQFVTGFRAIGEFEGDDVTKWTREDGGYDLHQISTRAEWICACSTMIYLFLFTREFKDITLKPMEIIFLENHVSC